MIFTAYRLELFKLLRRPAAWVVYLCFLTMTFMALSARYGPQAHGHGFPDALPALLTGDASLTSTFAIAVIVLMICSEFDWKTSRQNIIDGLSKRQWFTGKALLIPTIVIGLYLTRIAAGCIVALVTRSGSHGHTFDPAATYVIAACGALLGTLCYASVALLFCVTVRGTGITLATALIYQIFDNITALILRTHSMGDIAQWLPLQIQSALTLYNRYQPQVASAHGGLEGPGQTPMLFVAGVAWVAVLVAVSYRIYMKRDL
jgi:ABC-2 type transport system permease protein